MSLGWQVDSDVACDFKMLRRARVGDSDVCAVVLRMTMPKMVELPCMMNVHKCRDPRTGTCLSRPFFLVASNDWGEGLKEVVSFLRLRGDSGTCV